MVRGAVAILPLLLSVGLPARSASQVTAEPWFSAGTFMFTAEVGGAAFTDFERSRARLVDLTQPDVFDRRVSARTSVAVGATLSYWIRDGWGLRAGVSWIPTRFRVWNDESAEQVIARTDPDAPDPAYSTLRLVAVNGAAVFRLPRSLGRVVPYGIIGGGVIVYRSGDPLELPPEARRRFASGEHRAGAALLGFGATIPLQRGNLLMTFEFTDQITRSPLESSDTGEEFLLSGVPMVLVEDSEAGQGAVDYVNNLRLMFGVTFPFRGN